MSRRQLREFGAEHPDAVGPLNRWAKVVEAGVWENPNELQTTFGSADFVGTHAEYDEGKWK